MSSSGIVLIFITLVILGFALGLLFNRTRAIIRFVLFIGFYFLFYFILIKNGSSLLENSSFDVKSTLDTFINSFSQIVDQLNNALSGIGEGKISPISTVLNDTAFYEALINTLINFACHFIAIILSLITSFVVSFLVNIPLYILYNKRNKVVRVDEDGKEVPVKIKKKFSYRIVPAVLGAVLSATICVMVFSPLYKLKTSLNVVAESFESINTAPLDDAVKAIDNKSEELKTEYPSYWETFNNQLTPMKEKIENIEETVNSSTSQLAEKIYSITDLLPSNSFTDLVFSFPFDCYKMNYGDVYDIDIQLGSAFTHFTSQLNNVFNSISELIKEKVSELKI